MKKGYSQEKLANTIGISESHYQGIENGTTKPNVYLAMAIVAALDTTVEELFAVAPDTPK